MQKGSITVILLVLVLIVAALGGGYYLGTQTILPSPQDYTNAPASNTDKQQTKDETASWKTYVYDGFSLKLPTGWFVDDKHSPIQFINYDSSKARGGDFIPEVDAGKLKIEIYQDFENITVEKALSVQKAQIESFGREDTTWQTSDFLIGGQPGIKVKTSSPGFGIYIKHPQRPVVLIISFALDFDNYSSLAEQILSTFKFTN